MQSPELRQAKNALIARRRVLRDELNRVEQAIKSLDGLTAGAAAPRPRNPRSGSIKESIAMVLRTSGRIMHADEVVRELEARGIALSAVDPKATVVTALRRLASSGVVEKLPKNRFQWKGADGFPVIMPTDGKEHDEEGARL